MQRRLLGGGDRLVGVDRLPQQPLLLVVRRLARIGLHRHGSTAVEGIPGLPPQLTGRQVVLALQRGILDAEWLVGWVLATAGLIIGADVGAQLVVVELFALVVTIVAHEPDVPRRPVTEPSEDG